MKITILQSAKRDLEIGFAFYQEKGDGLGQYFMESLFSDIESLRLYGGIHPKSSVLTVSCQNGFPTPSTTHWMPRIC